MNDNLREIVAECNRLTSSSRVLEPEQFIVRVLIRFDTVAWPDMHRDVAAQVLEAVFKLLNIEKGNLSMQVSAMIGSNLCRLYERSGSDIAKVFKSLADRPTRANLVALGRVMEKFGATCSATVATVRSLQTSMTKWEVMYVLKCAFKGCTEQLKGYASPMCRLLVRGFGGLSDIAQMFAVKLMKRLVAAETSLIQSVIEFCCGYMPNVPACVKTLMVRMCAFCARISDLGSAFAIITKIRGLSKDIVKVYFEKLEPSVIVSDQAVLFELLQKTAPLQVGELVPLMSKSMRDDYFGVVLGKTATPTRNQVAVLLALSVDEFAAASLALNLVRSSDKADHDYAMTYFRRAKDAIQTSVLQTCLNGLLTKFDRTLYSVAKVICERVKSGPVIDNFVKEVLQKKNYTNPMLWVVGHVSAIRPEMVGAAVEHIHAAPSGPLLGPLLRYFAKVRTSIEAAAVVKLALANLETLNDRELAALLEVNPESDRFGLFLIHRVMSFSVSDRVFRLYIQHPMVNLDEMAELEETDEHRIFNKLVIEKFPVVFGKASAGVRNAMLKVLLDNMSRESHLLLLRLIGAHKIQIQAAQLYKYIYGDYYLGIQVTAELAARCNPPIETVITYCETQGYEYLLLLSACCSRTTLSVTMLLRVMNLLDKMVSDSDNSPIIIHLLTTIIATQSSEIMALKLGVHFLRRIFSKINREECFRPVIMRGVANAVISALPVISCSGGDDEVVQLLISILRTIQIMPFGFAKKIYYEVAPLVFVHVPQITKRISCSFPLTGAMATKIEAAKCMANLVRLGESLTCVTDIQGMFVMLQRTKDAAFVEYISAISSVPVESESVILQYLSVMNSVFTRNTLPGFSMVNPNEDVRRTSLLLALAISDVRPRESLIAATKAIEYGCKDGAFRVMTSVISHLQSRNDPFLEKIREPMGVIVSHACQCDLAISGSFLLQYLSDETVSLYLRIFCETCKQRSSIYFVILTKICSLASEAGLHNDGFIAVAGPLLREVATQAMSVSPTLPKFRAFVFDFYPNLFNAFIWTCSEEKIEFDVSYVFAFLFTEVSECEEAWRVQSALNGISELLVRFRSGISTQEIRAVVTALLNLFPLMENLMNDEVARFCAKVCSSCDVDKEFASMIVQLGIDVGFEAGTVTKIVDMIESDMIGAVASRVVVSPLISNEDKFALIRVILDKAPPVSHALTAGNYSNDKIAFALYDMCLRYGERVSVEKIVQFATSKFHEYGVDLGVAAICGGARGVCILPKLMNAACHEFENGNTYPVPLLSLFIDKFGKSDPVVESLSTMLIRSLENDTCINESKMLLKKLGAANETSVRAAWARVGGDARCSILDILSKAPNPE